MNKKTTDGVVEIGGVALLARRQQSATEHQSQDCDIEKSLDDHNAKVCCFLFGTAKLLINNTLQYNHTSKWFFVLFQMPHFSQMLTEKKSVGKTD